MPVPERVIVLFNPESTGDAPRLARELAAELAERVPSLPVELVPTERAGHARELAREAATHGRPLIVSVSGDGGYNEVVDGVALAGNPHALSAVLPAGNANDHSRATQDRPLADCILEGSRHRIDLVRVRTRTLAGHEHTRHAHSYLGLGLTPVVAVEIEKGAKGTVREAITVLRAVGAFEPILVELADGARVRIASLLLANIDTMAKVATLSEDAAPDDGELEVVLLRHRSRWRTAATAVRAATIGLGRQPSARRFELTVLVDTPMQLDGEVVELTAGTTITAEVAPGALATLR